MKMKYLINLLCATTITITMTGCIVPYARMNTKGFRGGYDDKGLGDGRYAIKILGNGYTSWEVCEEYFHRRAKELADGKKYIYKTARTKLHDTQHYYTGTTAGLTFHDFPVLYGEIKIIDNSENVTMAEDISYLEDWAKNEKNQ